MEKNIDVEYTELLESEQLQLIKEIKNGDKTKIKLLIQSYHKFICHIANMYKSQTYSYDDVYQDACIGLNKAIKSYNPDKNCSFISYASNYMRNECHIGYLNYFRISVPKSSIYYYALSGKKQSRFTDTTFNNLQNGRKISLIGDLNPDEDSEFEIKDEYNNINDFFNSELKKLLYYAIDKTITDERNKSMFIYLHGLEDGEPKTLRETGEKFHCTHQNVMQINNKCIEKIRKVLIKMGLSKELINKM